MSRLRPIVSTFIGVAALLLGAQAAHADPRSVSPAHRREAATARPGNSLPVHATYDEWLIVPEQNLYLPVIDDLVTQPTKGPQYEQRKQELFRLLDDMKPGVTQIIVHCTAPTEVFRYISGSGPAREAELRLMTDPEVRAFIKDKGIVLTTWRELKQRRDAVPCDS